MIVMNDFRAEPEELLAAELVAAERVLRSGWLILGKEVSTFEKQWATYCGTTFAVGVGNGMDAIEIALRSLHIGKGDEVITTPITAAATVMAIIRSGATPVLADIDANTALLDIKAAERCITARTKAIMAVHLYGYLQRPDAWFDLCASKNLFLIEDCAQAHGAAWNGRMAGTFGAAGAYSFYPTKNLGGRGDAGAIVTTSEQVASEAARLRNYGQEKRYVHRDVGLNSRLDELQAALLGVRLHWLDKWNQRRREIAAAYLERINNPAVTLPAQSIEPESHVYHLFVVRCQERDRLAAFLASNDIQTAIHYPTALHQQPFAEGSVVVPQPLRRAEEHASTCLSLPCHPQLTDNDVGKVIEVINRFRGL